MSNDMKCSLPLDTIVMVEEIDGTHCRISAPNKGWIFLKNVDIYQTIQESRVKISPKQYFDQVSYNFNQQWLKPC